jgi:hypothetical protein
MVFYNNFPKVVHIGLLNMKNDNLSEFLMDSGDNFSTDFQQSESSTQKPIPQIQVITQFSQKPIKQNDPINESEKKEAIKTSIKIHLQFEYFPVES